MMNLVSIVILGAMSLLCLRPATSLDMSRQRFDLKRDLFRGGGSTRGGASTVAATASASMTVGQIKTLNLLSGGMAGTVASCITNPLEVIRTQLQSSSASTGELAAANGNAIAIGKRIFEAQGVKGFFKGLRPTLAGIIPARSVYFFTYEQSKRRLGNTKLLPEGSVGNALISGFSAGIASNTLTNPIWMVKTRIQLLADKSVGQRAYTGYTDVIGTIFKEEGIGGFYRGITASYWGCAEGAIQFLIYEKVKKRVLEKQNEQNELLGLPITTQHTKLSLFCTAALAKGVAAVITYPHEVARTRLREQAREGVFRYTGMWQAIGLVAKEEGRSGLYAGMGVHLMKVIPNSAIMFLTYEVVNRWLSNIPVKEE